MSARTTLLAVSLGAVTSGCLVGDADDTQEIKENLVQAGFPEDDIMVYEGVVYAGRDTEVSLEASREMLEADPAVEGEEQYRTTNLVSRTLKTICVNGQAFVGFAKTSAGLNRAIANYNALALTFTMKRFNSVGGPPASLGCNAVITSKLISGTGGVSGFPSGGKPFGTINIGAANEFQFTVDTLEWIITHELGHTIGFRHTDFFNRNISCGPNGGGNEGAGPNGAVHVPGTPTGATVGGSIMNSCFRPVGETGDFRANDIKALQLLY